MEYSLVDGIRLFFVYGFLGWCAEVVYVASNSGKFVNRGFLTGPICPIYGIGVVSVLAILTPVKHNIILFFVCSVIITSVIEFLIGFVSEKLLHERLWDYSGRAFNIGGYVCLKFSLMWGIGSICVVYAVHPIIYKFVTLIPNVLDIVLLAVLSAVFLADIIITCTEAFNIHSRMKTIMEISHLLETVSDDIGSKLSDGVLTVKEKAPEAEKELKEKYNALVEKRNYIHSRLFKAFPNLQKGKYKAAFEMIKKHHDEKQPKSK